MAKSLIKLSIVSTAILGLNAIYPLLVLAQVTQTQILSTQQTTELTQQLNRGDYLGILQTPTSFSYQATTIDYPTNKTVFYINTPDTNKNPIIIYDGRYNSGFKVSVTATNYTSGENQISITNAAVFVSNLTTEEKLKSDTPAVTSTLIGSLYTDTPTENNTSFQNFPESGIIDLINAPACPGTTGNEQTTGQGRVGKYTLYPSFRLQIPKTTKTGKYENQITYTITDEPGQGC